VKKNYAVDVQVAAINWRAISLCSLLLTFVFAAPIAASQSTTALVPKNIAPHPPPDQPLPFSHKKHLEIGVVCSTCHVNPEPGPHMTFPETETCMMCHSALATEKPAIMALQAYSDADEKIPWVRVYEVTPGVTWTHRAHLDAGVTCETCHGDISQADAIAETSAVLAMATCISCHQSHEAPHECVTCHAWPSDELLGIK